MRDTSNKPLLLGFLLSLLLCAACWALNIAMLLFALVLPFFFAQLLLLRVTKKWPLRLLPLYPVLLMLLLAGYYWLFGSGWDALGALILGLASIAPILGCVLAVIVHRFAGRKLPHKWLIILFVLLGCGGAWLGQQFLWGYWERAFFKALSFLGCAGIYALLSGNTESLGAPLEGELAFAKQMTEGGPIRNMLRFPDRTSLKLAFPLALAVFLFLTVGYMVLSPWIDLSAIPEKLLYTGVTAETFPLVALYITLGNSFLEEFFFRGFAFLTLRRHAGEKFAYLFSGVTFAAYHVSILSGWFHPVWFVLFLVGLAVGGMLFNWMDRRGSLWCGWLVHAAADLAIMLIGMRMFGIL